jgi:hypothetical protein
MEKKIKKKRKKNKLLILHPDVKSIKIMEYMGIN